MCPLGSYTQYYHCIEVSGSDPTSIWSCVIRTYSFWGYWDNTFVLVKQDPVNTEGITGLC